MGNQCCTNQVTNKCVIITEIKGICSVRINNEMYYGYNSVVIADTYVLIDGINVLEDNSDVDIDIDINITGNADTIYAISSDIIINGNINFSVTSVSGNIRVGHNIYGSAKSKYGDIKVDTIYGTANAPHGKIV